MTALTVCRENIKSEFSRKDLESVSSSSDSTITDEGADFYIKGKKNNHNVSPISECVSSMSASDEDSVHKSDMEINKSNSESDESEIKAILHNGKIYKLRKQFNTFPDNLREFFEENCVLSQKFEVLQRAKWAEDLAMKKIESLQDELEDRNRQVKELWNVIQMLDDENMMLKRKAEEIEEMKKQLNKDLKVFTSDDDSRNNMFISCNTADWRQKLHQECSAWESRNRRDCKEKFNGSLRRFRQGDVKKAFKHAQEKATKHQKTSKHDVPHLKVKRSRSINFVKNKKMDKMTWVDMTKEKVQGFKREPFGNGCRSKALESSHGSKGAIWGYGLWPPEWTAVSNVFQEEIRSTTWEARE